MRFPAYHELSPEQEAVNNLPLKGNYLVTGPPGTGKTVMALYRGQMISDRNESVRLLMHRKLLSQYTAQVVKELGMNGSVSTFHSWLGSWCWANWRRRTPELSPYEPDWATIIELAIAKPPKSDAMPHLLVDEGQDMAPPFYMFARSIARGVTVFADENQRITSQNSTLDEIRDKIRPDLELQLTYNYRNTFEIAALAAHFHTGPSADVPKPPDDRGQKPSLHAHAKLDDSVEHIATYARNYRRQQVGVLVPNTATLKKYRKRLRASLPSDVALQYYDSKEDGLEVDFNSSGIFIVNWASAKGLEFDAVFLPELQAVRRELDDSTLLMQLYVLCSRARKRLFLSYTGPGRPAIADIFPAELIEDLT